MKTRSLNKLNHKRATISNLRNIKCGLKTDSSMQVILAHAYDDINLNAVFI
jgi:hypothetical protein